MLLPNKPTKEKILALLARLNELLLERGLIGEFCIIDNATRVIAFDTPNTTSNPKTDPATKTDVLNCARQVAEELGSEEDWMNSSGGAFISELEEVTNNGITISYRENHSKNFEMITNPRETTLYKSMLPVNSHDDFDDALAYFLDRFNETPSMEMLLDEPLSFATKLNDNGLADSYLASTAAHLCQQRGFKSPSWVNHSVRILERPWFAAKTPNLKAILLQESPDRFPHS